MAKHQYAPREKNYRRKKVGEVALEYMKKPVEPVSAAEYQKANEKGYVDSLVQCIQDNRKKYPGDFFIVVISKNEKLLYNVIRCYFLDRSTCPTPDYDQTVFLFRSSEEDVEHVWTVPDKETCLMYIENQSQIAPAEYPLLENVLKFKNGDLFRLCKKFNKEEEESPLLLN
jgi:hypothetical protein